MANDFDEFDEVNPFDEFDAPKYGGGKSLENVGSGQLVPSGTAAAKEAQASISGMSDIELGMAGAGKAPVDLWRGVRQIYANVSDKVSPRDQTLSSLITGKQSSRSEAIQQEIDEAAKNDKALMQTTPGIVGNIAGNLAPMVIGGVVGGPVAALANPATYGAAAVGGAIQGALQPVTSSGSRAWNTGMGAATGVLGQGIARGASALMAPEDAATKAVQALTDAGVPLDAAQRSGSMLLARAKAMLSDNPLTAGAQQDFSELQNKAVTRAFMKTVGANVVDVGPEGTVAAMGAAKQRLGKIYDDVASRVSIPYSQIEDQLSNIELQSRNLLNDTQFGTIRRNLDDIVQKASQNDGVINGEQFQNIKKTLDALSKGSDVDVGNVARDLRSALNDGLLKSAQASGNNADAALLKQTNQQYANMKRIEGALDPSTGFISPSKLANIFTQKANRYISIYQQGDTGLNDLAQAAKSLLPNKTPNSGTTSRIMAQAALPIALGGAEALHSGDWKKAMMAGAAGYALPKAIQLGLNSQGTLGNLIGGAGANFGRRPQLPAAFSSALNYSPLASILGIQNRTEAEARE